MRERRSIIGWLLLGVALSLFACEVESTFAPNDAVLASEDVALNTPFDGLSQDALACGGECSEFEECINESCVPTYCPPEGPFGVMPGDTLTDVVVKDCDGNDVHIHELCGANASFFNLLAGW